MSIDIPKRNKIYQNNKGIVDGTIWSTFNIDMKREEGKIAVSPRLEYVTNQDDLSTLSSPVASFAFFDNKYVGILDGSIINTTSDEINSSWERLQFDSDASIDSGLDVFAGRLMRANGIKLYSNTAVDTGWVIEGNLTDSPHSTTVFGDRFYVTDSNTKIYSLDSAFGTLQTSGSYTIDIANSTLSSPVITKIFSDTNGIWFCGIDVDTRRGFVGFWDGTTENVFDFMMDTQYGILTGVNNNGFIYFFDARGRLHIHNNGALNEVARLPVTDEILARTTAGDSDRIIHPNGIAVIDDEIYLNINSRTGNTLTTTEDPIENMPSGIWAYNPKYGLYHKYSASHVSYNDEITDYGTSIIASVGALFPQQDSANVLPDERGEVLMSCSYFSNKDTQKTGVFYVNVSNNRKKSGYFITNQITADNIEDSFIDAVVVSKKLSNSTDEITLKYRDSEEDAVVSEFDWSDSETLVTTADMSGFDVGDEIEILQGYGSGNSVSITEISGTGTYEVKIDRKIGLSGESGKIRIQKWKLLGSVTGIGNEILKEGIGKQVAKIQIKVICTGTGRNPVVERLIVSTKKNQ